MPAVIDLHLSQPGPIEVYPARLHGAACTLLEGPEEDHTAPHKAFSVAPPVDCAERIEWTLGWLAEHPPPTVGRVVRFGPTPCTVTDRRVTTWSYAQLATSEPAGYATLEFVSPLYFSRNGRDHPMPDPQLIVRSAFTRWNHHAPESLAIPDPVARTLLATVRLADLDGRTVRAAVTATMNQTGFIGTATLALTRNADHPTATVFAALMRFATIAGLGAQTTHGFGATRLTDLRPWRPR